MPKIYELWNRNHAIWPNREREVEVFLRSNYKNVHHKLKNAKSSNSEDALTWSCFDALRMVNLEVKKTALKEIFEDANLECPQNLNEIEIEIGKKYQVEIEGITESTEVDASIVLPEALVFIEAKLYSAMSPAFPQENKPYNQIAKKMRIGFLHAKKEDKFFYFIFLDLAPMEKFSTPKGIGLEDVRNTKASGFKAKWISAYFFRRYRKARYNSLSPLKAEVFNGMPYVDDSDLRLIKEHMGWITWADVFKIVLRAVYKSPPHNAC